MKFLVVVPSIRQSLEGFEKTCTSVKKSFTHPTDYRILDGSEGKPAALNRVLETLAGESCHCFVTLDDDYIPGPGWQDAIAQAFVDFPEVGVFAPWVGDCPELQRIMGVHRIDPPVRMGQTTLRRVQKGHHIAGAMLCYRTEVALQSGPQPITAEKYQIWEDAYRGRRVQSLGWQMAFVDCPIPPQMVYYPDPPEYNAWREEQIKASRKNQQEYLRQSGIADPWHLHVRRWVAKVRGRSKE